MFLVGLELVQKGLESEVSLNKTALFSLPSIVADTYFSSQSNVSRARFIYRSVEGNQEKSLIFKIEQATPTNLLHFSNHSRNQFVLKEIELHDFDGGQFRVPVQEVPSLDIDLI